MAKETVKVDVEEVKLETTDKMNKKKKKQEEPKKAKKVEKKNKKEKKDGYFKKVRTEMKLVTWPSRKSVIKYSIASILMIGLLAVFFIGVSALFDLLYSYVQGWIG